MDQTFTRMAERIQRIAPSDGSDDELFRFLVSTPGKKGDGLDIPSEAWDLSRYAKHSPILINHDIFSLPIGRAVRTWTDDTGLWADVKFSQRSPRAREVVDLIEEDIMTSTSVNFRVDGVARDTGVVERAELVEISMVSVPEDADVLMARSMWQPWMANTYVAGHIDNTRPRLDISTIWDEIQKADIADLELHLKDSLADVRALLGQIGDMGLSEDLKRDAQGTVVALRVLMNLPDDIDNTPDEDEVITIDLSAFPALTGATK